MTKVLGNHADEMLHLEAKNLHGTKSLWVRMLRLLGIALQDSPHVREGPGRPPKPHKEMKHFVVGHDAPCVDNNVDRPVYRVLQP